MKFLESFIIAIVLTIGFNSSAQNTYIHDRVYTANQISNTVSVVDPSKNILIGEIILGKPYPSVLSPLYRGQALVHGLRYSEDLKMLAVVSIGSNSVTLISTEDNKILKTIYIGRSPHEPTFTPDNKQVWVSVRGEAYISVIDVKKMEEVKRIPVADGPGMVSFSPDGKIAYVCSSFTPELDIVRTKDYSIIKRIPVVSPFSPNIFTSPDGKWVAFTHKDVGKVTVLNTADNSIEKVINTGAITNHVTFSPIDKKLLMIVTVGGENKVKTYDVSNNFELVNVIDVGALPHGVWPSPDGRFGYIGIEYGDQVQAIDLLTMKVTATINIGQSPQALVYASNAVANTKNTSGLSPLNDKIATQVIVLKSITPNEKAAGRLAVRSIGLADLIEQAFNGLEPMKAYTLALTKSDSSPFHADYEINSFTADTSGKYAGQSTGLIKSVDPSDNQNSYKHIILIEKSNARVILLDSEQN